MSKGEFTIGQVAKKLNTTPRALRFYEQKKLVVPNKVNSNGYRIYSENEIENLQVILYLRSLGFSIQKIKQLLAEENSSQFLELLITQEITNNKVEIENLKKKQKKLLMFKEILHKRRLKNEKISDITTIMKENTKLKQLRKRTIYFSIGMLVFEIIGILIITNALLQHHFLQGVVMAVILEIILLTFSIILAKKYYDCVAYICPDCGTKFIPTFKQFFFAAHTPRFFRKLRCPHCHEKSYCLEVIR